MIAPELFQNHPFFSFLTAEQRQALAGISTEESYADGAVIFKENDPASGLFILVKGSVDLFFTVEVEYHPEQRKELMFGTLQPGELFGVSALIAPHILTSSARASAPAQVIKIDTAGLLTMCQKDDQLAYELIQKVAKATMERLNATRRQLAKAWVQ